MKLDDEGMTLGDVDKHIVDVLRKLETACRRAGDFSAELRTIRVNVEMFGFAACMLPSKQGEIVDGFLRSSEAVSELIAAFKDATEEMTKLGWIVKSGGAREG